MMFVTVWSGTAVATKGRWWQLERVECGQVESHWIENVPLTVSPHSHEQENLKLMEAGGQLVAQIC